MLADGVARADLADRLGEDRRAAVGHVIPIDRCDDDVCEIERGDRMGDTRGLCRVDRVRTPMANRAVAARARADITEDHEGRGAVRPALADVGAARFFADGVKIEIAHQALEPEV